MRNLEEELNNKKLDIDNIEVPEELESRLRTALNSVEKVKNKKSFKDTWIIRHKVVAAVLAVIVFLGAYNYDVLAYYGKKILGYDDVVSGSLKELNELGNGQEINKSYKFKNGTEVTLDGVLLDDNKLVAMYTIKGESEEKIYNIAVQSLKGIGGSTYFQKGGYGKSTENNKAVRWIMDFETPKAFDTRLTINIFSTTNDVSRNEVGSISFKLDRNKAIKRMVKLNIDQTVDFQGAKYNFTTFSASALSVVLEGSIKVSSDKDRALFGPEPPNLPTRHLNVELWECYIKDGKTITEKIQNNRGSIGSGIDGIKFEYEFDGLKPNLQKLILKVVKTEDMKMINRTVDINSQTANVKVVPETEEVIIKNVKVEGGNTIVTFNGEKDVAFKPALDIDGKQAVMLEETSKIAQVNGKEYSEEVCKFEGSGKKMSLLFKEITHETYINKQITIYENK